MDTFIFLRLNFNKPNLLKLCMLCVWLFKSAVAGGGWAGEMVRWLREFSVLVEDRAGSLQYPRQAAHNNMLTLASGPPTCAHKYTYPPIHIYNF